MLGGCMDRERGCKHQRSFEIILCIGGNTPSPLRPLSIVAERSCCIVRLESIPAPTMSCLIMRKIGVEASFNEM